jgi:hypothetical protein
MSWRDRRVIPVLRKTDRTLEQYGWITGQAGNPWTGYCLVGAVRVSTDSRLTQALVLSRLRRTIRQMPRVKEHEDTTWFVRVVFKLPVVYRLIAWNDTYAGTPHRVRELVRRATPGPL